MKRTFLLGTTMVVALASAGIAWPSATPDRAVPPRKLAKLQHQISALRKQNKALRARAAHLQSHVTDLQSQVTDLQSQLAAATASSSCVAGSLPFSLDATLTGTWSGDDGAIMYVTQSGDDVWWVSMSGRGQPAPDIGRTFANVGMGTRAGDGTITAHWIDTPRGTLYNPNTAQIVFKLVYANGGAALQQISSTVGYGGRMFTPCSES
jgi:hypothetical protein